MSLFRREKGLGLLVNRGPSIGGYVITLFALAVGMLVSHFVVEAMFTRPVEDAMYLGVSTDIVSPDAKVGIKLIFGGMCAFFVWHFANRN